MTLVPTKDSSTHFYVVKLRYTDNAAVTQLKLALRFGSGISYAVILLHSYFHYRLFFQSCHQILKQ